MSLTKIWLNITKLGCGYNEEIEDECWSICPSILKDEHLGVFKNLMPLALFAKQMPLALFAKQMFMTT